MRTRADNFWEFLDEPLRGRALGIFSYGEETRNATMPMAVERAGRWAPRSGPPRTAYR